MKKKKRNVPRDEMSPIERSTRWLPLFMILLIIGVSIIYLQSTRIETSAEDSGQHIENSDELADKITESSEDILNRLPQIKMTVSSLKEDEEISLMGKPMPDAKTASPMITQDALDRIMQKQNRSRRAVELIEPVFVNSGSLTVQGLVGKKIIMVVFWSSSSVNSVRQAEFLKQWYSSYKDDGLEIVAVHTPEFNYEKEKNVVKAVIERTGINYPVVMDNDFKNWRAYKNRFWPAIYLIDIDGFIVFEKFGDAECEKVHDEIKRLLTERKEVLGLSEEDTPQPMIPEIESPEFSRIKTPAIYFGFNKNRGNLGNEEGFVANMPVTYKVPKIMVPNMAYLTGEWMNRPDHMEYMSKTAELTLEYEAKDIYIVAGPGTAEIMIDSRPANGKDVVEGKLDAKTTRLYHIDSDEYGKHALKLTVTSPELRIYSISFG